MEPADIDSASGLARVVVQHRLVQLNGHVARPQRYSEIFVFCHKTSTRKWRQHDSTNLGRTVARFDVAVLYLYGRSDRVGRRCAAAAAAVDARPPAEKQMRR